MVFNFVTVFRGKSNYKVSACFFEISYLFQKILPLTLSKELVAAYRKPPTTSKIVPKACDLKAAYEM
jgi:hypothetical protein